MRGERGMSDVVETTSDKDGGAQGLEGRMEGRKEGAQGLEGRKVEAKGGSERWKRREGARVRGV